MSLKAFHLVFITASILLAFGCVAWSVAGYLEYRNVGYLLFGLGAMVSGGALVLYSKYFVKKLKNISYL